jgi:branched-chain amino acid transport system ATP-binding protein
LEARDNRNLTDDNAKKQEQKNSQKAILDVSGLSVYYGETRALWDISLQVLRSELVTVIGANGAGKTTTLKSIQGLVKPRSGGVRFNSLDITGVPANRNTGNGISLVPEGRGLFSRMSVKENLELGAFTKRARRNIGLNLERIHGLFPVLKDRSSQMAGSLSGGEQQMLAIGRALMSEPELLMLDEPSLGLAPTTAAKVFNTLGELKRISNLTILLVEQDVQAALSIADRVYLFENGRVVLEGTPEEIRDNPTIKESYLGI